MDDRKHPPHTNPAAFERSARRAVARRLRTCRRSNKVTQTTLATHVGVTYQQIQKYETGRDRLSVERLLLIARVLGEPVERLLPEQSRRPETLSDSIISISLTSDGLESLQMLDDEFRFGAGYTIRGVQE